jgi:NTE family protein
MGRRLLEEPRFRITGISGTSAGAMNAAVLADGWVEGGAESARNALARFWQRVSRGRDESPDRPMENFGRNAAARFSVVP